MKNICILIFTLFFLQTVSAQKIGEDVQVSLLTCSSGDELYSTFGHSALRFHGMIDGKMQDRVYNYGTFDFGTDFKEEMKFYYKFAKGKLDYKLSEQSFPYFQYEYIVTNRGIVEQILDLTHEQKEKLYRFMVNNAKPENCYYRYDFFYDNCSSRIRDVLQKVLGDDLNFQPNDTLIQKGVTFRDMIQLYLHDMPWSDFGIDIALGLPCDKKISPGEEMFLPDYLMDNVDRATLNGRPLVKKRETLLEHEYSDENEKTTLTPNKLTWGLLIITVVITIAAILMNKSFGWYYNLLFVVTGLLGLLVFFLWIFTDHSTTKNNLNILWLMPLNLLVPFFYKRQWIKKYLIGYLIILGIVSIGFKWFPQAFHPDFFPLILTMLIATGYRLWFWDKK